MSPRSWLRHRRKRLIAGRERSTVTVRGLLLLLAAVGLSLASPSRPAVEKDSPAPPAASASSAAPRWTAAAGAEAKATAKTFLRGYLAYLYGQAPASQVKDASSDFEGSLERARPEVPPGIKTLHPRILSVTVSPQTPGRAIATALVSDTEILHYPIRLTLALTGTRWRVTGLQSTP